MAKPSSQRLARKILESLALPAEDDDKSAAVPDLVAQLCANCRKEGESAATYLNETRSETGNTALMWAAVWGSRRLISCLLAAGADPNTEGAGRETKAIGIDRTYTSYSNWREATINHGVPIGDYRRLATPLVAALESYLFLPHRDYLLAMEQLVEAGANVDQKDTLGATALMKACRPYRRTHGHSRKLAAALLVFGADPCLTSQNGYTALMWSISSVDYFGNRIESVPDSKVVAVLTEAMKGRSSRRLGTGLWAQGRNGLTVLDLLQDETHLSAQLRRAMAAVLLPAMFAPEAWRDNTLPALEAEWHHLNPAWRALALPAMLESRRSLAATASPRPRLPASGPLGP